MTNMKAVYLTVFAPVCLIAAVGFGRAGGFDDEKPLGAEKPSTRAGAYIIEPTDMLSIEAVDALPGRPISGWFFVGPNGRIRLSFYGEILVAGLTVPEAKERIVRRLRKHLNDSTLGLASDDSVALRTTPKVAVNVVEFNSKRYYAIGRFARPGGFPATGRETVLDAVMSAGGLLSGADSSRLTLIRDGQDGEPTRRWTIDLNRLTTGGDATLNPRLQPGDRLIAGSRSDADVNYLRTARPSRAYPVVAESPAPPTLHEPSLAEMARRLDRIEALLEGMVRKRDE